MASDISINEKRIAAKRKLAKQLLTQKQVSAQGVTENVYLEEQNEVVSSPVGLNAGHIEYLNDVQNKNEKPSSFVGYTKIAGDTVLNTVKGYIRGVGEMGKRGAAFTVRTAELGIASAQERQDVAFSDIYTALLPTGRGKIAEARISEFFGNEKAMEKAVLKLRNQKDIAQNTLDQYDNVLDNMGLKKAGNNVVSDFGFALGQGGQSLVELFGASSLMKDPISMYTYLSEMQKNPNYIEAREAGIDVEEADVSASVRANTSAVINTVGFGLLGKWSKSSKGLKRIVGGVINEAAEEGIEEAADIVLTNRDDITNISFDEGIGRVAYASLIGGVLGAPAALSFDNSMAIAKEEGIKRDVAEAIHKKISNKEEQINQVVQDAAREQVETLQESKEEVSQSAKLIDDFVAGNEIDPSMVDDKYRAQVEELIKPRAVDTRIKEIKAIQGKGFLPTPKKPETISDFLRKQGGLKIDGDTQRFTRKEAPILKGVAKKTGKLDLDKARELAEEEGFIPEGSDINTLLDALEEDSIAGDFVRDSEIQVLEEIDQINQFNEEVDRANLEISAEAKAIKGTIGTFKEGVAASKKDIKVAQEIVIKAINDTKLPASDKAKFIATVKNTTAQNLEKTLAKVQEKTENILNQQAVSKQKTTLRKELSNKAIKPKKGKGKFDVDTQKRLDELSSVLNISGKVNKDIGESPASIELSRRLEQEEQDVLANRILNIKANPNDVSAAFIAETIADIKVIKILGSAKAEARRADVAYQAKEIRDGFLDLSQPKKQTASGKIGFFTEARNTFLSTSTAWRQKIKTMLTSNNAGAVDDFLESIDLTENASNKTFGTHDMVTKFKNLMMKNSGFKNEKGLLRYLDKSMKEFVIDKEFTFSDGKRKRLKMTRAEARKRVMEWETDGLLDSMMNEKGNAYTEDIVQEIRDSLSSTDHQLIASQLKFYDEYYDRINKKYEELNGVTLKKVDNYSPIRREYASADIDDFLSGYGYAASLSPKALKERVSNIRPVKQLGDIEALYSHINEMEYYLAYIDKVTVLKRAFSDTSVQSLIREGYGDSLLETVNKDLDYFAVKGSRESIAGESLVRTLGRNFAVSNIVGKPNMALKQLTSLFTYAGDVGTPRFMAGLAKVAANPMKTARILNETATFKNRGIALDKDFQELISDKSFLNVMGKHPKLLQFLSIPVRFGDKGAILMGGGAYYHSLRAKGVSHEAALKKFEQATNRTQQSTNIDQLSELQRSNSYVRLLTQFLSSPNAMMRAEYEALIDFKSKRISVGKFAEKIFYLHFLIPNLFQFAANGFSWDDEDQLKASILGNLNGILIFGSALESIVRYSTSGDFFDPKNRHILDFTSDFLDAVKRIDGDYDLGEFIEDTKMHELLLDGGGKLTGVPAKTMYRRITGAAEGLNARDSDDVLKAGAYYLGYSPYVIQRKILGESGKKKREGIGR